MTSVVGIAAVELVTRQVRPDATHAATRERLQGQRQPWKRPDAQFHHVGSGSFELRFPERGAVPTERILIVGDSFAMGHGVGQQARFGTLLQRSLGDGVAVDVLAISSHSPIIYRNVVREATERVRYSAIALFVDQTDPADDAIYQHDLVPADDPHLFDVASMNDRQRQVDATYDRMLGSLDGLSGLARRLAIVNVLSPLSLATRFPAESEHASYVEASMSRGLLTQLFQVAPEEPATHSMEILLFHHLDEIVRRCAALGTPLLLAANPWEHHVSRSPKGAAPSEGYPRENRLEQLLAARYGGLPDVSVLELTRAFREHPDPSALFLHEPANEIHWNEEGHALVERVLRGVTER